MAPRCLWRNAVSSLSSSFTTTGWRTRRCWTGGRPYSSTSVTRRRSRVSFFSSARFICQSEEQDGRQLLNERHEEDVEQGSCDLVFTPLIPSESCRTTNRKHKRPHTSVTTKTNKQTNKCSGSGSGSVCVSSFSLGVASQQLKLCAAVQIITN